jgi:single-stranded-DNA-specific exonuclease
VPDLYLLPQAPRVDVERLERGLELSSVLSTLLWQRGLRDVEAARGWLHPGFESIGDPYDFTDMNKAVQRVRQAIRDRERILIHGDYDVDGLTGTVVLLSFLRLLGAEAQWHVPSRGDGYSFAEPAVKRIAEEGFTLCISVDNGTAAIDEVRRIQEAGCDVIVTDHHHTGPEIAPAFATLNPRLDGCGYPFPWLAGCAVAFKLAWAIAQSYSPHRILSDDLREFLVDAASLVALGSVADVVPLKGENRALVRVGLKALLQSKNPGLRALVDLIGPRRSAVFADDVSFRIGPRLNAAGRMGQVELAIQLLTATSYGEARKLASQLDSLNRRRQKIEAEITKTAFEQIDQRPHQEDSRILVVWGEGWHVGVVGIVAARISDHYRRPAVVLAVHDEHARGSGRSHGDIDLKELLERASGSLNRYGGHRAAVGMELDRCNVERFAREIEEAAATLPPLRPEEVTAEARASLGHWNTTELRRLADFRPFGEGNRTPTFLAEGVRIGTGLRRVGTRQKALAFTAIQDGCAVRALAPSLGPRIDEFARRRAPWNVVYTPQLAERAEDGAIELRVRGMEQEVTQR